MAGNTFVDLSRLVGQGEGTSGWSAFEEASEGRRGTRAEAATRPEPARPRPEPPARPFPLIGASRPREAARPPEAAPAREQGGAQVPLGQALRALPAASVWRAMAFPSLDAESELRRALIGAGLPEEESEAIVARVAGFGPALRAVFAQQALNMALVLPGQRVLAGFTSGERRLLDAVPETGDVEAALELVAAVGFRGPGVRVERVGSGMLVRKLVRAGVEAGVGGVAVQALDRGRHVVVAAPLGVEVGHAVREVVDAWRSAGPVIVVGEEGEGDSSVLHVAASLDEACSLGVPVATTVEVDAETLSSLWAHGAASMVVAMRAATPAAVLARFGDAKEYLGFVVWVARDGAAMVFGVDGGSLVPWGGAEDIAVDEP